MTAPERSDARGRSEKTSRWLRELRSLQGVAPGFDTDDAPEEPTALFLDWLEEAVRSGVAEPHAATLSTIGPDGIPDARTLLLKNVDPTSGWAIAGPRASRKAAQLAARPAAALNFWWQPVLRAVRVRGTVTEATPAEIEADFMARPTRTSASPDDWCLWWIRPIRVEFWQGDASRDHTRLVYRRDGSLWTTGAAGAGEDGERDE